MVLAFIKIFYKISLRYKETLVVKIMIVEMIIKMKKWNLELNSQVYHLKKNQIIRKILLIKTFKKLCLNYLNIEFFIITFIINYK